MKRYLKLSSGCAIFLLAMCLSASANSNYQFSNLALTGVSGTVSGSFTYNASSDTFSGISLTFTGGVFGGVKASNSGGNGSCKQNLCGFYWQTTSKGNTVWNAIVINLQTGQYQEFGSISNSQNKGFFDYQPVPEGGATLGYLMLSGIAVFGGIVISGKKRRRHPRSQVQLT